MTGWVQRIRRARIRRRGDEQLLSVIGPIADSIDDALVCLRPDGAIALWNRAAALLTGYSADEMNGRPFADVVPLEARSEVAVLLRHTVDGGRVVYWAGQLLARGKGSFRVSIVLTSIKDPRGRTAGAVAIVRDRSRQLSGGPAWRPDRPAPASPDADETEWIYNRLLEPDISDEELDAAIDELTREDRRSAPPWLESSRGEVMDDRSGVYPRSPLDLPESRLPSAADDLEDGQRSPWTANGGFSLN